MASNVPVTVMGTFGYNLNWGSQIIVGDQKYYFPQGRKDKDYWLFILDLTTLQPVVSMLYPGGGPVPPEVQQYANKTGYLLIVDTYDQRMDNVPKGDFYNLLVNVGAGCELMRWEQLNTQMGTGTFGQVSYILAATMSFDDAKGLEAFSIYHAGVLTFVLVPTTIDGKTVYFPAKLC